MDLLSLLFGTLLWLGFNSVYFAILGCAAMFLPVVFVIDGWMGG